MEYFAKAIRNIDNGANRWEYAKIGVFRRKNNTEEQIGEYQRNYPSFFNTFFHFQQNDKDFALYSPDYTVTRIMELPSCKDIGGENPNSYGFCPVDYFVPTYIEQNDSSKKTENKEANINYYPVGFVAGCIWGDDSSWKIQYLDLSEVGKGIVKRDERFGYIELSDNLSLKDAIDMYDYGWDEEDESAHYIRINIQQTFDLRSGKSIKRFD